MKTTDKKKLSQNAIILNHLRRYGSITQMEAWKRYRITCATQRVYDLKKLGYNIGSRRERYRDGNGRVISYARYFYEGGHAA